MSTAELFDPEQWDAGGRVFVLEIAGIGDGDNPVRYYSGPDPGTKNDAGSGKDYVNIEAIVGVGPLVASVRPGGGVASYSPIAVTLARTRDYPGTYDPGVILRRAGFRFGAYARLVTTLESDDTPGQVVYLDRDPATLGSFPGHITIGRESCWATAAAGDGTLGNPWRLTGVTRAIRGTLPLVHYVGNIEPHRPYVKREVTTWKNRRAILRVAHLRLDGTVGDYAVAMRGFLRGAPVIEGDTVSVEIVPMVGIMDRKISADGRRIGLHPTRHCAEGSAAVAVWHAQSFKLGEAFRTSVTAQTAAAVSPIPVNSTATHSDVFDVTLDPGHPRNGPLWFNGRFGALGRGPWGLAADGYGGGGFTFADANQAQGAENGETVTNQPCAEAHNVYFLSPPIGGTEATLTWPGDYLDAISGASGSGWRKGQRDGLSGAWADLTIIADDAEVGPHIRVSFNETSGGDPLYFIGDLDITFAATFIGALAADWETGRPERLNEVEQLYYPIWFAGDEYPIGDGHPPRTVSFTGTDTRGAGGGARTNIGEVGKIPIKICAGGWYQRFEKYITTNGDFPLGADGYAFARIEYTDPADGQRKVQRAKIVGVTNPEAGVYRLEVWEPHRFSLRSFGDWAGLDPVVITPDISLPPGQPGIGMLRLLLSIGGNGLDSGFDVLPFGGELLLEDVDQLSFRRATAPAGLESWAPVIPPEGMTLAELCEPILRAMGRAMVMRYTQAGACRVALVPIGAPTAVDAVATSLVDGRWFLAAPPDGAISEEDITNIRKYLTDHADGGEGDAQLITNVYDGGSIAAYGAGASEEIELRGINLRDGGTPDILATLLGIDARLAQVAGYAVVRWTGETSTPDGWLLHPGAVVAVTSDYLAGFSDTVGVAAELARVMSIQVQLWQDGCALKLEHHGNNSTGWNLALKVVDAPALDEVEVDVAGTWAPDEHPVTGEALDPLDYLVVGQLVDAVPWGDHDSRVQLTVDAIDTGTRVVTLSGNHGLTGPNFGRIVWTDYDDAPTVAQQYAYLADDNNLLGAANDEGFELV